MMHSLLDFICVLSYVTNVCLGCSPISRRCGDSRNCETEIEKSSLQEMQRILPRLECAIQEGRFRLPLGPTKVVPETDVVVESGQMATFTCPVGLESLAAVNNTSTEIVWKHRGQHIPYGLRSSAGTEFGFVYSFALDDIRQVKLFIHDTPLSATGEVQCYRPCNGSMCLVRTFHLRIQPKPADVFAEPLSNTTATGANQPEFRCSVNALLSAQEVKERFMWRFNKRILYAPSDHPFFVLTPFAKNSSQYWTEKDRALYGLSNSKALQFIYSVFFFRQISPPIVRSSLVIENISLMHSPGRMECWFQHNPGEEEWLINAAYLNP